MELVIFSHIIPATEEQLYALRFLLRSTEIATVIIVASKAR